MTKRKRISLKRKTCIGLEGSSESQKRCFQSIGGAVVFQAETSPLSITQTNTFSLSRSLSLCLTLYLSLSWKPLTTGTSRTTRATPGQVARLVHVTTFACQVRMKERQQASNMEKTSFGHLRLKPNALPPSLSLFSFLSQV